MQLIPNWNEEERTRYGEEILVTQHRLAETGLFTDEALAKMLDNHPSHLIDFQYVAKSDGMSTKHLGVDFSGADGQTMIDVAHSDARVWINVREVMNRLPEYREVLEQLHAEMEALTGRNKDRRNCRGGVLISSATAGTPYHADPTMTHLWHIRGRKKFWAYPRSAEFMTDEAYEGILLGGIDEDIPWKPEMDKGALLATELQGGEFVSWPHRTPHRVENASYCVSMTMEFSTSQSAFVNAGMYANGVLRRRMGANPDWGKSPAPLKFGKAAVGQAMRKLAPAKKYLEKDLIHYRLDKNAANPVVKLDQPYERQH